MIFVLIILAMLLFLSTFCCKYNKTIKYLSFFYHSSSRFVFISGIWGLLFSFLIIPWQTPDEYSHLAMIGAEIKNDQLAKLLVNDMPLEQERIRFNKDEKLDSVLFKNVLTKKPEYSAISCMPKGISIKCVRHFSATMGILLGIFLRLPTYWVLQLGELFSLLFYIFVCAKAISLTPIKKHIFEIVMLFPMCIQQAASISYDAVLLPLSFWLIAYIMHLKFEANSVGLKEILTISIILLIIAIIKIPYILLGGTILLIPIEKLKIQLNKQHILNFNRKILFSIIGIFIAGISFIIYIMKDNEFVRLFFASILEWPRTLYLFKATMNTFSEHLIVSLIGNFGWLDTPLPLLPVIILASLALIFSAIVIDDENTKLKKREKGLLFLIVFGLFYLITISMIPHTILVMQYGTESVNAYINYREALYQIPYIGGTQGRYYIPLLIPLFLTVPNIIIINKRRYIKLIIVIESFYIVYASHFITLRYWA